MLIYCTLQMHVQQATYANELHVNVQHKTRLLIDKNKIEALSLPLYHFSMQKNVSFPLHQHKHQTKLPFFTFRSQWP